MRPERFEKMLKPYSETAERGKTQTIKIEAHTCTNDTVEKLFKISRPGSSVLLAPYSEDADGVEHKR
jgi:hypothetical protein